MRGNIITGKLTPVRDVMQILKSILRFFGVYFIFFSIAIFSLKIIGGFVDIESKAGEWYHYLHYQYDMYEYGSRPGCDINPVFVVFLFCWILLLPLITSVLYLIIKKYIFLRRKNRSIK
jgi:hypothetical protein